MTTKTRDISSTINDHLKPARALLDDLEVLQQELAEDRDIDPRDRVAVRKAAVHVRSAVRCLENIPVGVEQEVNDARL